jgi:flagellar basal body-associated protein FliL
MADDKKKEAAEGAEPKKKSPLIWIILAVVLCLGGIGAGIFLAPKFMKPAPHAEGASAAHAAPESSEHDVPPIVVPWPPLVVDITDEQGGSRHVKLVMTLEIANEHMEKELASYAPRGRQAALGFIRAKTFQSLTDPTRFESLQKEITEIVQKSVGKSANGEQRVSQILITDLVAQ